MLPYDSSGDEDDDGMNDELQRTNKHPLPDERFFFHFGDPLLESKVYGMCRVSEFHLGHIRKFIQANMLLNHL